MNRDEIVERILEIRSGQVDFTNFTRRSLTLDEEIEISNLQKRLEELSFEEAIKMKGVLDECLNNGDEGVCVQYVRLKNAMSFEVIKARSTVLEKDAPGFILDENTIRLLHRTSEFDVSQLFEMLENAKSKNVTLALIQGFPCMLKENHFYTCEKPNAYPVPGQVVSF